MHDCMSDTLVIEDPGFQAASLKNLKLIALLSVSLLLGSMVILFCEIVIRSLKNLLYRTVYFLFSY